jgi:hypothetical protein
MHVLYPDILYNNITDFIGFYNYGCNICVYVYMYYIYVYILPFNDKLHAA